MAAADIPIITTSERRDLKRCVYRWWWRYREGLTPKVLNQKLWFGIGIHEALAVYFAKGTRRLPSKALDVWHAYCDTDELSETVRMRGELEDDEAYALVRDLGAEMLRGHHEHWGGSRDLDIIFTEKEFSFPIPSLYEGEGVAGRFCSTFDGVARWRKNGMILLLEHKTAASISTRHLDDDEQTTGYWMVADYILHDLGVLGKNESINGVLFNFLAKRLPTTKQVNADGLVLNKDGSISKQQPPPRFERPKPVLRTRGERQTSIEAIASELEHVRAFKAGELPLTKNHTMDCFWDCPFHDLCALHDQQAPGWEEFRDAMFTVQDPYRLAYRKAA